MPPPSLQLGFFLAALAAAQLPITTLNNSADDLAQAANLERFWSYDRSPPVYPSPSMSGVGHWEEAYQEARALVAQMTNDEKNNVTYGQPAPSVGCSGVSGSVPRLQFPGLCLQDSGNGVRATDGVNGYPSGISIGAAWNKELALQKADHMGAEFKAKGANVVLGPVAGPLGRVARGGRNWEGFSNDPYLAGSLTRQAILGIQKHAIACAKHFVANEQETHRNPPLLFTSGSLEQAVSSNIDDKTMHELYAWPFQDAVHAGAGAVMCSYNQLNGSYGCQNSKALNGLLKEEFGFQGFVVSDWFAQHSGVSSANAGMDMAMPGSAFWQNGNLSLMVSNGSISQSRLDDMATRIVATWYRYAHFQPGTGMPASLNSPHELVDARDPASESVILQSAIEGHVLVKNEAHALPLRKPKVLSIFGYDAVVAERNSPTGGFFNKWDFTMENTQTIPGSGDFSDSQLALTFLSNEPWDTPVPGVALNGTMITGGGSGATTPATIDAPFNALQRQAKIDRTLLYWDFVRQDPSVNPTSDACIVFINEQASEGWDRPSLANSYSDTLVENVASKCNNTHVVIHNAGIRLVDRWIENPNITAVIFAHLPGQETGQAIVDVFYGHQSPSGRLPYTVAKHESDYGQILNPDVPTNATDGHLQSNFTEGVYIDYRHFLAQNITPRYEFGFGLTYSDFTYSDIAVKSLLRNDSVAYRLNSTTLGGIEGGDPSLWDVVATVSCTIRNTGTVAAAEVAQLYVHIPGGPDRVLRGFEKRLLQADESAQLSFELTRRDVSEWDVHTQSWRIPSGTHEVMLGKSVLDIHLHATLTM